MRSSCCTDTWDGTCVEKAGQLCFARYLTRTRVEDERVMTDACVEPQLEGVPSCPLQGSGPLGAECCRRTLVLEGVYTAHDVDDTSTGRKVTWAPSAHQSLAGGGAAKFDATLVPDPVITYANGQIEHTTPHHLWQAAGPGGPIYPDCSGATGPRPCNASSSSPGQMVDPSHTVDGTPVGYRPLLVAVLSSLITTSGSYEIDLRWGWGADPTVLAPDPEFDDAPVEAYWGWSHDPKKGTYEGRPLCYVDADHVSRANGLVDSVPACAGLPWPGTIVSRFHPAAPGFQQLEPKQ